MRMASPVKQDGAAYQMPIPGSGHTIVEFNASGEWQRVEILLTEFPGFDPKGAMAFFLGSPGELGPFWLEIDNVALE